MTGQTSIDALKRRLDHLAKEESAEGLVNVVLDMIVDSPQDTDSDSINFFLREYLPDKSFSSEMFIFKAILQRIQSSKNRLLSWLKYEVFLTQALLLQVLSPSSLEDAVLPLLKEDLPEEVMLNFASCLKSVIESYKKKNNNGSVQDTEFLDILEWVSWAFSIKD
jgi:hypothetical protein